MSSAVSVCRVDGVLLLERALFHPVLLALGLLALAADPLLPERLDVQSVVNQSCVHLKRHNIGGDVQPAVDLRPLRVTPVISDVTVN